MWSCGRNAQIWETPKQTNKTNKSDERKCKSHHGWFLWWSSKDRFRETKLVGVSAWRLSSDDLLLSPLYINLHPTANTPPPGLATSSPAVTNGYLSPVTSWRGKSAVCDELPSGPIRKQRRVWQKRLMETTRRWVMAYMWEESVSCLWFEPPFF